MDNDREFQTQATPGQVNEPEYIIRYEYTTYSKTSPLYASKYGDANNGTPDLEDAKRFASASEALAFFSHRSDDSMLHTRNVTLLRVVRLAEYVVTEKLVKA